MLFGSRVYRLFSFGSSSITSKSNFPYYFYWNLGPLFTSLHSLIVIELLFCLTLESIVVSWIKLLLSDASSNGASLGLILIFVFSFNAYSKNLLLKKKLTKVKESIIYISLLVVGMLLYPLIALETSSSFILDIDRCY